MNTWCEYPEHLLRGLGAFGAKFGNIGANVRNIRLIRTPGAKFGNNYSI